MEAILKTSSPKSEFDIEIEKAANDTTSKSTAVNDLQKLSYQERLARHHFKLWSSEDYRDSILTFRKLRKYDITRIEHDLLRLQLMTLNVPGGGSDEDRKQLTSLLRDHGLSIIFVSIAHSVLTREACAVRDRDFLAQNLVNWSRDTEYVTRTKQLFPEILWGDIEGVEVAYIKPEESDKESKLKNILNGVLPHSLTWKKAERLARPESHGRDLAGEKGFGPRQASMTVQIISSLIISIVAGAFIIAPIAIMKSYSYHGNLLTVSLWVILFGFFLAAVVQAKNQDIFIATATYAAVLVVFVGAAGGAS
jgi:hypothetical protein